MAEFCQNFAKNCSSIAHYVSVITSYPRFQLLINYLRKYMRSHGGRRGHAQWRI